MISSFVGRAGRVLIVVSSILSIGISSTLAQTVTPSTLSIGGSGATAQSAPVCFNSSQTQQACIQLGNSTTNKVDVFFLFDDTGSFAGFVPTVTDIFSSLVSDLETALPEVSFGFGVGRFEDYGGPGRDYSSENSTGRPFTLNQPIITKDTAGDGTARDTLINDALNHTAPGFGGDGPETSIAEGLFQVATGVGFDGDGDGLTTGLDGTQTAGALDSQVNTDISGDVPAFSTRTVDVLSSGSVGGAGFRSDALKLVILATDICSVAAFDSLLGIPDTIAGIGSTEAVAEYACSSVTPGSSRFGFVGDSLTRSTNTIAGAIAPLGAATVPQTIAALNAAGIRVLGMAPNGEPLPSGSGPGFEPSIFLSALARTTGAVDSTGTPLVFSILGGGEEGEGEGTTQSLKDKIVEAVLASAQRPVDVALEATGSVPSGATVTDAPAVVQDVAPGGQACFDVTFAGAGKFSGSFDLTFKDAESGVPLAGIPTSLDCPAAPDCLGVLGGSAKLDRCGVCNGDGTSCLGCVAKDNGDTLFALDGNSASQRTLVKNAARRFVRLGGSRKQADQFIASAEALHVKAWGQVWTQLPRQVTSCSNTSFCVSADNTSTKDGILSSAKELNSLLRSVVSKTRKLRGSSTRADKDLLTAGDKLVNQTKSQLNAVVSSSTCGGEAA